MEQLGVISPTPVYTEDYKDNAPATFNIRTRNGVTFELVCNNFENRSIFGIEEIFGVGASTSTFSVISTAPDDNKMVVDGGTWSNGETVTGPATTPGTGTVSSTGANSLTLATFDETFPKRWIANAGKYAIGPEKEVASVIETDQIVNVGAETLNINGFYGIVINPIAVTNELYVSLTGYTGPGYNQGLVFRDQNGTWHEIGGDIYPDFTGSYLAEVQALGFTHITGFAVRGNRPEPEDAISPTNFATCFCGDIRIDGVSLRGSNIEILETIGRDTVVYPNQYTWEAFIAGVQGAIGEGSTTSVNAGTILTFATNKDLNLLSSGDAVTQDDGAASGTVASVTGTTMKLTTSTGTWSANTGNYVVGPELPLPDPAGVNFVGSEFQSTTGTLAPRLLRLAGHRHPRLDLQLSCLSSCCRPRHWTTTAVDIR